MLIREKPLVRDTQNEKQHGNIVAF